MKLNRFCKCLMCFMAAGLLATATAFAEKPEWAGGGHQNHGGGEERNSRPPQRHYHDTRKDVDAGGYFDARQRLEVRDYYAGQFRGGRCPPGLAKKQKGCVAPGQAKQWTIGRPLPRDAVYYDLPPEVAVGIGPPPAGYKFVRVTSDILMIAAGSGMVVDAIRDLGGF